MQGLIILPLAVQAKRDEDTRVKIQESQRKTGVLIPSNLRHSRKTMHLPQCLLKWDVEEFGTKMELVIYVKQLVIQTLHVMHSRLIPKHQGHHEDLQGCHPKLGE